MPKRIGYLYEKFVSQENCVQAERLMAKNKTKNCAARRIGENAVEYGTSLSEVLSSGKWKPGPNRERDILDSYKGKKRHLKIPCLMDQAVQYAWLNVAEPYIIRRNYYYNCGSIPGAGQIRAVRALQKWLAGKGKKYALVTDIYHFYDTCPHWAVMRGLRRIFKDGRFLAVAEEIMDGMSDTGTGLAIGHPASHWLANVALMEIDHDLCRQYQDVQHVRYMDDIVMVSNNKRHLRAARDFLFGAVSALGMGIKRTWQLFRVQDRGIQFLSYRFFRGYTVMAKRLMYRIARRVKAASRRLTVRAAASVISYMGILKHCDSYHFRRDRVYPYVSIKKCKELISDAAKQNTVRRVPAAV